MAVFPFSFTELEHRAPLHTLSVTLKVPRRPEEDGVASVERSSKPPHSLLFNFPSLYRSRLRKSDSHQRAVSSNFALDYSRGPPAASPTAASPSMPPPRPPHSSPAHLELTNWPS
ncbi:hypothetical protein EYF80_008997 [Liparis tanakae]|uniref:Uncharacterized protein n=1 Tax=Liparis tanakae TaxID=230148 RepID=A0A4Z2IU75_9TELE|nr:hypothetical protein EYF80_008997 [Liparis tanakae]